MTYANQNINLEQYYNTARNWVTGSCKPSSQEHLAVLAELTGINPDKLF